MNGNYADERAADQLLGLARLKAEPRQQASQKALDAIAKRQSFERRARLECLSIAAHEAQSNPLNERVEDRAERLLGYVLDGRRKEAAAAAAEERADQRTTDRSSERISPAIEIRQMPNGTLSAWFRGEILPIAVVSIQDASSGWQVPNVHFSFGASSRTGVTFGPPVFEQLAEQLSQDLKDALPRLFEKV